MSWLIIVALALLWVLVIAWTEHRSYGKGRAAGYMEAMEDSVGMAVESFIKAEDERLKAYAAGKRDATVKFMEHRCKPVDHTYDLGCLTCRTVVLRVTVTGGTGNVPAGTPVVLGIDKADGPDTTVCRQWSAPHMPDCKCNSCTWPHKPDWRCDCKECIKAYSFGRDS